MTVNAISANRVRHAIALASQRTGIGFDYLLGQAKLESGLNATARARTSSATGLYQFIDQSWLAVVKKHGSEHGLGWAADGIGRTASGRLTVSDPATRQAIMDLRNDPAAASLMAAEHASDNKASLEASLGREATGTDLYMAHFLGLGGATKFLKTMQSSPGASGAAMFPAAARANRSIFYDGAGQARPLADIYNRFAGKLERGAAGASEAVGSVQYAAQALDLDGATVVTGGESATDALAWASSAMDRFKGGAQTASVLRPTPDTARLAYMMLASMGA
jgi:hypothetical protein